MQPLAHDSAGAATAILAALGATPTPVNVGLLEAWITCEKGTAGDAWQWNNPLNTTEPGYGSTQTVNTAGVRVYPTPADGVAATVATLTNGYYPILVQGLRTSDAGTFFSGANEISIWGTDPACVQAVYAGLGLPNTAASTTPTTATLTVTATGITVTPAETGAVSSPAPLGTVTLYPYAAASPPQVTPLPEYAPEQAFANRLPFNERLSAALPAAPYEAQPLEQQVVPTTPAPPSLAPWLILAGLGVSYLVVGRRRATMKGGT